MSVAVYPQLDELLRERNLSVAELRRRIEERYGLVVASETLDRLARSEPVQQTDLTIAGATAKILGVELGDLFAIEAIPIDGGATTEEDFLDPEQGQRMAELLHLQDVRPLGEAEQCELQTLLDEYGLRLNEYLEREIARKQGVPVEQVRREADEHVARASAWWQWINANPRRRRAFEEHAKQRRDRARN